MVSFSTDFTNMQVLRFTAAQFLQLYIHGVIMVVNARPWYRRHRHVYLPGVNARALLIRYTSFGRLLLRLSFVTVLKAYYYFNVLKQLLFVHGSRLLFWYLCQVNVLKTNQNHIQRKGSMYKVKLNNHSFHSYNLFAPKKLFF